MALLKEDSMKDKGRTSGRVPSLPVVLTVLLLACGERGTAPVVQRTSTFPLTIGSRWHYYRIDWDVPFNDSTHHGQTDTTEIIRRVIAPDSIADALHCVALDDTCIRLGVDADPYVDRHWYCITDNKLTEYGRQLRWIDHNGDPWIYQPRYILLDFPLVKGKWWKMPDDPYFVGGSDRFVLGPEIIIAGERLYDCDLVGTRNPDDWGHPDFYSLKEWFCNDGLIHSESDFGVLYIMDEQGRIIDSTRAFEKLQLLDINVVLPHGRPKAR
jgi:hypothetical protein